MKRIIIALVLVVVLALAMAASACGGGGGNGAPPFTSVPDNEIWIWGKQWWASGYNLTGSGLVELKEGDTITIAAGTEVAWFNKENSFHMIVAGEDPIEVEYEAGTSETLRNNDSYSRTWLDSGMFLCHQYKNSMAYIAIVVN